MNGVGDLFVGQMFRQSGRLLILVIKWNRRPILFASLQFQLFFRQTGSVFQKGQIATAIHDPRSDAVDSLARIPSFGGGQIQFLLDRLSRGGGEAESAAVGLGSHFGSR